MPGRNLREPMQKPIDQQMMPYDLDAERAVLGAVLIDDRVLDKARLGSNDFYRGGHGTIWDAMRGLRASGMSVDLITLTDSLRASGVIEKIGGAAYLSELLGLTPTAVNFVHHERIVSTASLQRRIILACAKEQERAFQREDPDGIIASLIDRLNDIRAGLGEIDVRSYRDIQRAGYEAIERNYELHREGKLAGITTGFPEIDEISGGFRPGRYHVIAARTGKGKTSLAMQMARAAARAGRKVGIVSIEMDAEQLSIRDISSESDVDLRKLNSGNIYAGDWDKITMACGELVDLPVWVVFDAFTAEDVERSAFHLRQVLGVEVLFVDYLQLLTVRRHDGNREQEVSRISRMHKRLAKQLGIPVVALAQLNRAVENRQDKRPTLADLRESGSIEQDADVVAFIHHDDCRCPLTAECSCGNRYIAWYLQRKGRMDGTGDVKLGWKGRTTTFRSLK